MKIKKTKKLGCRECRATPKGRQGLPFKHLRMFYDSSHESLALCRCRHCGQHFIEQSHEIVNWGIGDDDMWSYWLPVTEGELRQINNLFPREAESRERLDYLYKLMHTRPRLTQSPDNEFYWDKGSFSPADRMLPFA